MRVSAAISRCQRRSSLRSFLTGNLELGPTPPGVVNLAEVDSFVLHAQIADVEFGAWARNANPPSRLHLQGFVSVFVVLVEPVPLHHACRGRAANAHLPLGFRTDEPRPLADGLGPCAGTFLAAFIAHFAAAFLLLSSPPSAMLTYTSNDEDCTLISSRLNDSRGHRSPPLGRYLTSDRSQNIVTKKQQR